MICDDFYSFSEYAMKAANGGGNTAVAVRGDSSVVFVVMLLKNFKEYFRILQYTFGVRCTHIMNDYYHTSGRHIYAF